jgi:hypothetical protein
VHKEVVKKAKDFINVDLDNRRARYRVTFPVESEDFCLDIQATVGASASRLTQGFCSGRFAVPVVLSAGGDNANQV